MDPSRQKYYEEKFSHIIIKDPWTDRLSIKSGLPTIYIRSSLAETMRLSANYENADKDAIYRTGADASVTTCNPVYDKFQSVLNEVFDADEPEQAQAFSKFREFVEQYLDRQLLSIQWDDYIPDIRVVETIDEAVYWLYLYITESIK